MINNMPVIDLHLFRLGSRNAPLKKVLSLINNTASQFIEQMKDPKRFYTYAYLREDRTPYYIGKGQGRRIVNRTKRDMKSPKDKSRIIFLKQNLTEEDAFRHEKYMIAVFGRKDLGTGILRNKTDGGEGVSGFIPSEETRKKISEKNKGRKLTEEHKEKLREANENQSEETRRKKAHKNNNFAKGNKIDREIVDRLTEQKKKNKWWNNGIEQKFCRECPSGWISGRLPLKKGNYSKPGEKNPRAKVWEITYDDGRVEIVKCLKEWCKKTNYNFSAIRYMIEKNKPYRNILKIVSLGGVHRK
jgi:hypothetical protein